MAVADAATTPLVVLIYSAFLIHFLVNPSFSQGGCSADILGSGKTLSTGESLTLGGYSFTLQADCNLVLYDGQTPIWASNTGGLASNCYCSMQNDGNLVVYGPDGTALWASNTGGEVGNYILVLQDDRNVVIYGTATWATGTSNSAFNSKRTMKIVSIPNLPAPVIYSDGAKNVTEHITTKAGIIA